MNLNTGILIRPIRMVLAPETINGRIDLDCVYVCGAPLQGPADVITGTGADNQHVLIGLSSRVSIQQVRKRIGRKVLVSRNHLLVIEQVYGKRQIGLLEIYSVGVR